MNARCATVIIASVLSAAAAPSWAEDAWKSLEDRPAEEWFRYAEKCRAVDTDESLFRAKLVYESLARLDATADGIEARAELAMLLQSGRFGPRALRAAVVLLSDLVDRFDHERARKALETLKLQWAGPKEAEISAAKTAMSSHCHEAALTRLSRALAMPFAVHGPVGEEIDSEAILTLMALASAEASAGIKAARNMPEFQCPKCEREGFVKCVRCKGKGRVSGWTVTKTGASEFGQGRCPECRGLKKTRCVLCAGSGLSSAVLDPEELKSLAAFMPRILPQCEAKTLAEAGFNASQLALMWGLRFPPSVKPDDVESRRMVPFPGEKNIHPDFAAKWKGGDVVCRLNLLMDIAILTARQSAVLHLFSRCPPPEGAGGSFGIRNRPVLPLAVVQAFPDRFGGMWIAVRGKLGSTEPCSIFEGMRELLFVGGERSALAVVSWSGESKAATEYFASMLRGVKWAEVYARHYEQSGLDKFLDGTKAGAEIIVTGRLWHDPKSWPRSVFEVWAADSVSAAADDESDARNREPSKKAQGSPADPMVYLRGSLSFGAFKSLRASKPEQILQAGLERVAAAGDMKPGSGMESDWRSAWKTASELEQAKACFEALMHKCPEDALADELVTHLTRRLLEMYREIGRK